MNKNICVIGLGYIGLPTAAILAENGFKVHGVDIDKSKVDKVNAGQSHFIEPGLSELINRNIKKNNLTAGLAPKSSDIFIIAVPTPFKEDYQPNIDFVRDALKSIIPVIEKNNMIIIESTIPVGTTRIMENFLIENDVDVSNLFLAHCPERVLPGNIIKELKNNDRIVGGTSLKSTEKVSDFYKSFVKGKVFSTNDKTAEMAKLIENSYRDLNIAFANEISMICENENINPWELISLANKHPRVNVLNPSPGVGGHCIAIDPWFLISKYKNDAKLIEQARNVNLSKTEWVIDKIEKTAKDFEGKLNKKPTICCMGLAYKPNVDDIRESPSIYIVNNLMNKDYKVIAVEPNIESHESIQLVSYKEGLKSADIVVWLVNHNEFKESKQYNHLDFCGIFEKNKE